MIQYLITGLLIFGACCYLARLVYQWVIQPNSCTTGCTKCSSLDFKKIEDELNRKNF